MSNVCGLDHTIDQIILFCNDTLYDKKGVTICFLSISVTALSDPLYLFAELSKYFAFADKRNLKVSTWEFCPFHLLIQN